MFPRRIHKQVTIIAKIRQYFERKMQFFFFVLTILHTITKNRALKVLHDIQRETSSLDKIIFET